MGRGWVLMVPLVVAAACSGNDSTESAPPVVSDAATTVATPPPTDPAGEPPPTGAPTTTAAPTTTEPPPPTDPPPPPGPQPVFGGEVVYADFEPSTLNTFIPGGDVFAVSNLGQLYWTGVQDIDAETLELIPDAVTELPTVGNGGITVNADGTMTVRYQIRDEAVWADGVPISGDDFQFTYDTIMTPGVPIDTTIYEDIVATTAGPKTFEYTLREPTPQAELIFGVLLPKHDVEGSDFLNDWNDTMWVSGGPFVFESWTPGESIRVVRNENYWKQDESGQQLPYLDSVVVRFYQDDAALDAAFRAREIDVFLPVNEVATLQSLQELETEGAEIQVRGGPIWEHLNFQFGERRLERNPMSLVSDVRFRQAVAFAVDEAEIADEVTRGLVGPLDSYVVPFTPGWSARAWEQYDHDPARAAELVADLCADFDCGPEGRPTLVFSTTTDRSAVADLLVPQMDAAGINLVLDLEESVDFFGETLDFGGWELGQWSWVGAPGWTGVISIHDVFDPQAPPPDGPNFYRWGTPAVTGANPARFNQGPSSVIDETTARFTEVRNALFTEIDERELLPLLQEAEQILADQVVIIPLYARPDAGAVWADEVAGFEHNPTQAGPTWNVEEWFRADS